MTRFFGTVCLAAVAFLAGAHPVHAQNREHQQMAAELRMLQEQQQQLALALTQLAEALKTINARFDETTALTRKSFADQGQDLKNVATDLGAIRERLQESDTRIRTLADEVEALRLTVAALPNMVTQAAQAAAVAAVGAATAPAPDPADPAAVPPASAVAPPAPEMPPPAPAPVLPSPPAPPATAGLSPNRMYETAYGDYASGQWTLAIGGFEQLVRTFPQSERADDAQFFIGEAYVALNRFPEAIAAYNLVIQNYPKGDQAHLAYYKRGLTQERLKQVDAARTSYETAIKLYPDSVGAVMSKPGLDRLDRTAGTTPAGAPR